MSEELNSAAAATIPATEPQVETTPAVETTAPATDPLANAAPAEAPKAEAPAPAIAEQATIDAASATTEVPAAPAVETPAAADEPKKEEAAAAEQPPTEEQVIEITEDLINKAIDVIKATRRSSVAMLQRKLQLGYNVVVKILDELTAKGVLGPQEGNTPRKILIELPPEPPKIQVSKSQPAKKPFKGKPRMTDYDRMMSWREHLKTIGHYTDEGLINALADYASRNPGFNPHAKWGSCLIVMINRLAGRTLNSLRTFTQTDADNLVKELLRFFAEQPLGDNAIAWNEKFQTNMEQKRAISEFFGINKSYRDLRGNANICLTAVRDAAWPTKEEEAKGTGGTFAERFHYLALCIVKFGSSDFARALFENSFHTEPTDDFLNRVGGIRRPTVPSWIKDGHCTECGSEVIKDSRGNDICASPICEHHFAVIATDVAKSFRSGSKPRRDRDPGIDPSQAPLPLPDGNDRRRNWKDKKDRRHDTDDNWDGPKGKFKKHGKRFHANEDDDGGNQAPSESSGSGETVFTAGNGTFQNNAFAGLELPTAPAAEQLPEPPPEVPVA